MLSVSDFALAMEEYFENMRPLIPRRSFDAQQFGESFFFSSRDISPGTYARYRR